jgi:hypothetical protein
MPMNYSKKTNSPLALERIVYKVIYTPYNDLYVIWRKFNKGHEQIISGPVYCSVERDNERWMARCVCAAGHGGES